MSLLEVERTTKHFFVIYILLLLRCVVTFAVMNKSKRGSNHCTMYYIR